MVDSDEAKKDSYRTKIYNLVSVPAERWNESMKDLQKEQKTWTDRKATATEEQDINAIDARLDEIAEGILKLDTFRKKLRKYISAYEYISQVIDLGDPDLEAFCGFARLLGSRLDGTPVEMVDISSLVLADFKVKQISIPGEVGEGTGLRPLTAGGKGKTSKKESLKAIVEKINEIWGEDVPTDVGARAINAIADYVAADDVSRTQIQNTSNSRGAVIADGRMENIIRLAAISLKENELGKLADRIITDPQTWKPIAEVIFDLVDKNKRIDMPELMKLLKETPESSSKRPS